MIPQERDKEFADMIKPLKDYIRNCPDCAVAPGESHISGCDVARCTACGYQRISCEHGGSQAGWDALWTGIWPGELEAVWYGVTLNDLYEPDYKWDRRFQVWRKV